jgi:hypothetical protein
MSCFYPVKKVSLFAGTKEDLPPTLAPTKPYDQQETLLETCIFHPKIYCISCTFRICVFVNGKLFIIQYFCATDISDTSYRTWFAQYFRETLTRQPVLWVYPSVLAGSVNISYGS